VFPIVLGPRYQLSLCHTPIKPDLIGFPGIDVLACGLRDHVIMRFASIRKPPLNQLKLHIMSTGSEIIAYIIFGLILK